MKPGRYTDIDLDEYHRLPGVSRSTLHRLSEGSPLECLHYQLNGIHQTPAILLGNLVDCLVYEPDRFGARFAVRPKFGRTKAELAKKDAWLEAHSGLCEVSLDLFEQAQAISNVVTSDKAVRALMGRASAQESWWWEEEGTLCKTRPDGYDPENGWTFDLKTVYSLSDRVLQGRIKDGGYDIQAAMNLCGARANDLPWNGHLLIWACTSEPYDVRLWLMEPGGVWLSYGLSRFMRVRRDYQRCIDENRWPGRGGDVEPAAAPKWIAKQLEDEEFLARAEARA